jgi:hypothetical protein
MPAFVGLIIEEVANEKYFSPENSTQKPKNA